METIIDWCSLCPLLSPHSSLFIHSSHHSEQDMKLQYSLFWSIDVVAKPHLLLFKISFWRLFMGSLNCLDSNRKKKMIVLLLTCSSTFSASHLNECGHYWLTHSCPAVSQCPLMGDSFPIQMRDGIGRQLRN